MNQFKKKLIKAFPPNQYPDTFFIEGILDLTWKNEVKKSFLSSKWTDQVNLNKLIYHQDLFYVLNDKAAIYFLPAFIQTYINWPNEAIVLLDALDNYLWGREKFKLLNKIQLCIILDFYNYVLENIDNKNAYNEEIKILKAELDKYSNKL